MSLPYNMMTNFNPYANLYPNTIFDNHYANLVAPPKTVAVLAKSACNCQPQGDTSQFLNQYQSQMKGLTSAANKLRGLNGDSAWSTYKATSSDPAKAQVSAKGELGTKANYEVNVLQLAQEQVSQSEQMKSSDLASGGSGQLQISRPDQEKSLDIKVETAGRTNREVQGDLAIEINKAGLGLTATVVEKDGSSYLEIRSETGQAKGFAIKGSTDFTTTKTAQDLQYTLSKDGSPMGGGKVYKSASNEAVLIDTKGIFADFKAVGQVKINVGIDSEKIMKATEDFVNQYNKTLEFLVDNAHRGTGVTRTLDNFMRAPIAKDTMKSIGITREDNGVFTFDQEKFAQVVQDNPGKVYDILADNYSIADGVYQDAQRGANESANALTNQTVNKSCSTIQIQVSYYGYNPFGYYNLWQPSFLFDQLI